MEPLAFTQVAPGLHVHAGHIAVPDNANAGDTANIAFIIGESAVAVVDAGGSRAIGERVVAAVRRVTDKPITWLILTHMHPDHVAGAGPLLEAGARLVTHASYGAAMDARRDFYRLLEERRQQRPGQDFDFPPADITITEPRSLDLGNRILDLQAWPVAHTATDLTVLDRSSQTLIAGDLVFVDHVPTLDGSLKGWLALLPDLAAIEATHVVPGHGPRAGPAWLPWPAALGAQTRYLETLARDIRALITSGAGIGTAQGSAAATERDQWALFGDYNAQNVSAAFTELEWE